jgi:small subunit ribosomal protein S18
VGRNSKVQTKGKRSRTTSPKSGRIRRGRPKVCRFCAEQVEWVDYKNISVLQRFMSDRGRIKAREATGTCAQHQRDVAVAIKTARELALLPYTVRSLTTDTDRRGGSGRRRGPDAGPAAAPAAAEDSDDDLDAGEDAGAGVAEHDVDSPETDAVA